MKKHLKSLCLSFCALVLIAGCSCNKNEDNSIKANVSNGEEKIMSGLKEGTESITLENIYDQLKAEYGNEMAVNEMLSIVGDLILTDNTWKARYDKKIDDKMMELVSDEAYQKDGIFDEELLVKKFNEKMYGVVCENSNTYGPVYEEENPTKIDKYMICDYTKYIDSQIKVEVLTEILKEKYIYDKVMVDKENILATKKARLVEYFAISNSDEENFEYLTKAANDLSEEESTVTLESIGAEWVTKLKEEVDAEYAKIGTSGDAKGTILKDFTNGYEQEKEKGLADKKQAIDDEKYYDKLIITSDSNSILNTTLVERILSENVLDENARKTIEINDKYYLVSPFAGTDIDANDIKITDSDNSKYYIIAVSVINNDSDDDMIYEAVKIIASNETLTSNSLEYFLEQYKNEISVHDEEIYTYFTLKYPQIFTK